MRFKEFEQLLWKWGARQQDDSGLGWMGTSYSEAAGEFDFKSTIPHFEEEVSRLEAIIQRYSARAGNEDKARVLNAKYGASRDFYDASTLTASQIAQRLSVSRSRYYELINLAEQSVFTAYLERWEAAVWLPTNSSMPCA